MLRFGHTGEMAIDHRPIDLVCWDFGDTVCDQTFMQVAPDGVDDVVQDLPECSW